jgi:hypothetical protein
MGWGQRWPERIPRPKARRLTEAEKDGILASLERGIVASPVLSAFGVTVRVLRGHFYGSFFMGTNITTCLARDKADQLRQFSLLCDAAMA